MGTLVASVKSWANAGLALLYPEVCQLCEVARATPAQGFVCPTCREEARFIEPPFCEQCGKPFAGAVTQPFVCAVCQEARWQFRTARSAVEAKGKVLEVIHRYKYQRALWFESFLAGLLIQRAVPELSREKWDCVAPVPLHPAKEREREFNQAERLARRLSAATGIPLNSHLVQRIVPTRTQTLLSREERLENVRHAFAARRGVKLNGERVVLVDDVLTTGATTSACAGTLRRAGAGEVCVWTVARGI